MIRKLALALLMVCYCSLASPQSGTIDEQHYVTIGGIEQWITIAGNDSSRPVILFLHGGPGSVLSPYCNAIYGGWKDDFILVNWDQRGAGRTFGHNIPGEVDENYWINNPLTVDRMVQDGIELSEYLVKHLGKQKIILIGTSWGSILGVKMAMARPDLYYAYLGHSQFVNLAENMKNAYGRVYELAEKSGDTISVGTLDELGIPPYKSARNAGQLLRIIKKYERDNSVTPPENWWKLPPEYDNAEDSRNRYDGDDYSFIYFVGHEELGIKSMVSGINFIEDGFKFEIPVYLVEGEEDILTSPEINRPYFDKIEAPEKEYYLLPGAGHTQNEAVVEAEYSIVKTRIHY